MSNIYQKAMVVLLYESLTDGGRSSNVAEFSFSKNQTPGLHHLA